MGDEKRKSFKASGKASCKKVAFGQIFKNGLGLENVIGNSWTLSRPPPQKKNQRKNMEKCRR